MNATRNNRNVFKGAFCALGVAFLAVSGGVWAKGISEGAVKAAAMAGSSAAIRADLLPTQLDQLSQLKRQVDQMNQQIKTASDMLNVEDLSKNLIQNQLENMNQNLWQWGGSSIMNMIKDIDESYASEQAALYDENSLYFTRQDDASVSASGSLRSDRITGSDSTKEMAERRYSNAKAGALAAGRNAKDLQQDSRAYKYIKGDNDDANGALKAAQVGNAATIANGQQLVKLREALDTQTVMAANSQAEIAEREAKEAAFQKGFFETSKINASKGSGF